MFESVAAAAHRSLCTTSRRHSPWQIASGIALGACCGMLIGKSLLGTLLLCAAYFLPIHLPVLLVSTFLVAAAIGLADPVAGLLGSWALRVQPVRQWVGGLQAYPFAPWLRLNNTVVQGYLLIAVGQLMPTFLSFRSLARWCGRSEARSRTKDASTQYSTFGKEISKSTFALGSLSKSAMNPTDDHPAASLVLKSEDGRVGSSAKRQLDNKSKKTTPPRTDLPASEICSSTASEMSDAIGEPKNFKLPVLTDDQTSNEAHNELDETAQQLEKILAERSNERDLNSQDIAQRASELASLVGDMLASLDSVKDAQADLSSSAPEQERTADSDLTQRDTTGRVSESEGAEGEVQHDTDDQLPTANSTEPEPVNPISRNHPPHELGVASKSDSVARWENVTQHEDALRYLLHHLKEIQEKV